MQTVIEIIGWSGSILYLLSYILLAINLIDKGRVYYYLNIVAALFVIIISFEKTTYQAVVINFLWGLISFNSIYKFFKTSAPLKPAFFRFINILLLLTVTAITLLNANFGIQLFGWLSVIYFISSYFYFASNYISEKEFHIWNFLAALAIIPQLYIDQNWPVIVLEVFWAAFAVWGYKTEEGKLIPE